MIQTLPLWVAGRPTPPAVEEGLDVAESALHASGAVPVLVGESCCVFRTRPLPASAGHVAVSMTKGQASHIIELLTERRV